MSEFVRMSDLPEMSEIVNRKLTCNEITRLRVGIKSTHDQTDLSRQIEQI